LEQIKTKLHGGQKIIDGFYQLVKFMENGMEYTQD